jgi:hypothetical protein
MADSEAYFARLGESDPERLSQIIFELTYSVDTLDRHIAADFIREYALAAPGPQAARMWMDLLRDEDAEVGMLAMNNLIASPDAERLPEEVLSELVYCLVTEGSLPLMPADERRTRRIHSDRGNRPGGASS